MSDFLQEMARASRQRLDEARGLVGEAILLERIRALPPAPALAFHPGGFDVIAEMKLVSPAAGRLREDREDVEGRVRAYAGAGALAVSVLTEPSRFGGSLEHLQQAAAALAGQGVPAMRKDFLVDPYQVLEARAAGAGGVLVILAMLDDRQCREMLSSALEQGMFVLLEAFDREELARAGRLLEDFPGQAGRLLVGLNCRDLRSLQVDPGRFEACAGDFPAGCRRVAESGIATPDQARRARELGYQVALVGTALMRDANPGQALSGLLSAARVGEAGVGG